jgi:hypothetical protein
MNSLFANDATCKLQKGNEALPLLNLSLLNKGNAQIASSP